MKKYIFVKFPQKATIEQKKTRTLINVCAWCPKEEYPRLTTDEDYTHELCEKHYLVLKQQSK